ncbi:hypothetical protein Syun_008766 [Stephania yunnanensis]|uniref:Uncharacterized protein n=1 Tax=Stephania yunnanensis TaxID=152371 RepID=A0AAP0PNF6_9MAGN
MYKTNLTLGVQLQWFQQLLPSLCGSPSNCKEFFKKSLFLVGEIGGNDYNHPFSQKRSVEEIRSIIPKVVQAISSAVNTLIGYGAVTLFVPGNLPIGCSAYYLTLRSSSNKGDYDTSGCLTSFNEFSKYHNILLQKELKRLQVLHPNVTIIYGDYYNAAIDLYYSPSKLGFSKGGLRACCGGGGPYNFNTSARCGNPGFTVCEDPSSYVNWDGIHLTEAAYKWIANFLLQHSLLISKVTLESLNNVSNI